MLVELTKEDLKNLVKGVSPNYHLFEHPLVKKSGTYAGGFRGEWTWNYGFEENLTENELWELYVLCRDSFS